MRPSKCSVDNLNPGVPQLLHRAPSGAGLDLHRPGGIAVDDDVEPGGPCVERRRPHAIFERQTRQMDGLNVPVAEHPLQFGVLKGRKPLAGARVPFVDNEVDPARVDSRVQLRARRVPHTVHGPAPAVLGERAVVRRVPVARGDDERRAQDKIVDAVHDRVAVRDRKRTSGTEVVLDVDDDQYLHHAPI